MPFRAMIYVSRRQPQVSDADVANLAAAAAEANELAGLTGALVSSSRFFAQLLEGPTEPLKATFDRIAQDPRHSDLSILSYDVTVERAFPRWNMAYGGASPMIDELIGDSLDLPAYHPGRAQAAMAFRSLLERLVESGLAGAWQRV